MGQCLDSRIIVVEIVCVASVGSYIHCTVFADNVASDIADRGGLCSGSYSSNVQCVQIIDIGIVRQNITCDYGRFRSTVGIAILIGSIFCDFSRIRIGNRRIVCTGYRYRDRMFVSCAVAVGRLNGLG